MGATELIQGLGRGLAMLREMGADGGVIAAVERDVTALDAIAARDFAAGERAAADLVHRLYAGHATSPAELPPAPAVAPPAPAVMPAAAEPATAAPAPEVPVAAAPAATATGAVAQPPGA